MTHSLSKLNDILKGSSIILENYNDSEIRITCDNLSDFEKLKSTISYLHESKMLSFYIFWFSDMKASIELKKGIDIDDLESFEGIFSYIVAEIELTESNNARTFLIDCFDRNDRDRTTKHLLNIAKIYPLSYSSIENDITVNIR